MGAISDAARSVLRYFVIEGVADSGKQKVSKAGLTETFDLIDLENLTRKAEIEAAVVDLEGQIVGAAAGLRQFDSWTGLNGNAGTVAGQPGRVTTTATTTHTDPVVGGTVPDQGEYIWSTSPAGWKRIGNNANLFKADKAALDNLESTDTTRQLQPNLLPDDFNKFLSTTTFAQQSTLPVASTYLGRPCWAFTVTGSSVGNFYLRLPRSAFSGSDFAASLYILGLTTAGSGASNTTARVMIRQFSGVSTELTGERFAQTLVPGAEPLRIALTKAIHASALWIEIYVEASNTGGATSRTVYVSDLLLADGQNTAFRLATPPQPSPRNQLPNDSWAFNSTAYNLGTVGTTLEDGFVVLEMLTGSTPTRSYVLPAIGRLAPGKKLQVLMEGKTDGPAATIRVDVLFRNSGGTEIASTRIEVPNRVTSDWQIMRGIGVVPALTVTIQIRVTWFTATGGTYARFRKPALLTGADQNVPPDNVITVSGTPPALPEVYMDPTSGNDGSSGELGAPVKTFDRAMDICGGIGTLYVATGVHDTDPTNQLDVSRVKWLRIVGGNGAQPGFARSVLRYGLKLASITKTGGQTKVYQSTIALAGVPNFIWHDGVPDARTAVAAVSQHAALKGRGYRLEHTRIERTGSGITHSANKTAAMAEIDGAGSSDPRHWYSTVDGAIYFSIAGGGSATASNIYVSVGHNLCKNNPTPFAPSGRLELENIDVRYAGVNLRGLASTAVKNCFTLGSPENGFDISGDVDIAHIEAAGAGSGITDTGDGVNNHDQGDIRHTGVYVHDNRDDGMSLHENSRETGIAFAGTDNMGSGLCPAYGAGSSIHNPYTARNALASYRLGAGVKAGGIEAHQGPNAPYDNGLVTFCEVFGGVSVGDRNGFSDSKTRSGAEAYLKAFNCIAIDPVDYAFACQYLSNCRHEGTGTTKYAGAGALGIKNGTLVT